MYHLLRTQQKLRPSLGKLAFLVERHRLVLKSGSTREEPERQREISEQDDNATNQVQESEATEAQPPMLESENENVSTVIGEPIFSSEETAAITIVVNSPPILSGDQCEETETSANDRLLHPSHRLAPIGWTLAGVIVALAGLLIAVLILPWFETSATVTIVPLTRPATVTFIAHLVTGSANLARQQIQGRQLAVLTLSQSKTVPTTGSGTQPTQVAQGMITFYNALPTAQTIAAGTLIIGQDGTLVTTDATITIPAGQFASNGQAQVSAHATTPGPAGNIPALNIDGPCCRSDVLAQNAAPFTGGQNARVYQAVSAQDITVASTALEATLSQDATAAYQANLMQAESLITPVACDAHIAADHPAGSEATQVTVTVTEMCQGTAYYTAEARTLSIQALNEQRQTGAYQINLSALHIQIILSGALSGDVQIQVVATLIYHWNKQQLRDLAALIAGKSEIQAKALLLQQPGIAKVIFSMSGRSVSALPGDPERIQIATMAPA